jgi:DNA-binding response OmpR family regulator
MSLRSKRVLYVDDDADALVLLRLMLREATSASFEVWCARTAAESLAELRQRHYDLVILSSYYEDGSGVELCRQIREFGLSTPILFYSGEARLAYKEAALQAGAQAYAVKPDDLPRLIEMIEGLVHGEGN